MFPDVRAQSFSIVVLAAALSAYSAWAADQLQNTSSSDDSPRAIDGRQPDDLTAELATVDEEQLDDFTAELATIDLQMPQALDQLHDLGGRVEAYHEELFTRTYNTAAILKKTEYLQWRIGAARQVLLEVGEEAASKQAPKH